MTQPKVGFDFPFVGKASVSPILFVGTAAAGPNNTSAATSVLGSGVGVKTLPAGFLSPGVILQFTLNGFYSTATSSPGTLTFAIVLGGTNIATTGAVTPSSAISNNAWCLEALLTCGQSGSGTSGQIWTQGIFYVNTAAQTQSAWQMVNATVNTLDTTVAQTLDVQATFATASASNVLTCTNSLIEFFN